jgi:hypothetical protein
MNPRGFWTLEQCKKSALPFNNRGEWKKNSPTAYRVACKNKWLEICCTHMDNLKKPKGYWTKQKCHELALKCKNKKEFREKYSAAETYSQKKGWLIDITNHMESLRKPKGYWTLERCMEDAKRFNFRTEWAKKSAASYRKALRKGWIDLCMRKEIF